MKFNDEFTPIELSKELKELGVKQESLWYWTRAQTIDLFPKRELVNDEYSAFTATELGQILPYHLDKCGYLSFRKLDEKNFSTEYSHGTAWVSESEAISRAKILIFLIKSGQVKV